MKGVKALKWSNVFKVFRWEFLKNVKSPVFLIATLMFPLLMLLGAGIGYYSGSSFSSEELQVAVIDETREFFPYLESNVAASPMKVTLHDPAQREQLSEQVKDGELNGYLIFTTENVQSGMIDYYVQDAKEMNIGAIDGAVTEALTLYRMEKLLLCPYPCIITPLRLKGNMASGVLPHWI